MDAKLCTQEVASGTGQAPAAAPPTALCFPEFGYGLRAVQRAKRAQIQAARHVHAAQPDLHSAFTLEEATADEVGGAAWALRVTEQCKIIPRQDGH